MLCWSWHPPYHQRTHHITAFYLFVPKMGPIWETEKKIFVSLLGSVAAPLTSFGRYIVSRVSEYFSNQTNERENVFKVFCCWLQLLTELDPVLSRQQQNLDGSVYHFIGMQCHTDTLSTMLPMNILGNSVLQGTKALSQCGVCVLV